MSDAGLFALAAANLLVGLYSLESSIRYGRYRREARRDDQPAYQPTVALLVPCAGLEDGLSDNLRSLLSQRYPNMECVFIVEDEQDAALDVIRSVLEKESRRARIVRAGPARGRGQKVHNLLAGIQQAPEAEVLAFADSDVRPDPDWLGRLVAPLGRSDVGVATGYRFYLPEPGSPASVLRSVWNAGVLTLLGDHDHNFAWGGSMAIRRSVFDRAEVMRAWSGALSDDYALTHAVRRAGYSVLFVPSCLLASRGRIGLSDLARWCSRQMAITRVYWPNLWRIAGGSQVLFVTFLIVALVETLRGRLVAALLLSAVLTLSLASGEIRRRAVDRLAPQWKERLRPYRWSYVALVPAASLLTFYGFLRSATSRRIEWRGKIYRMRSPTQTILEGTSEPQGESNLLRS